MPSPPLSRILPRFKSPLIPAEFFSDSGRIFLPHDRQQNQMRTPGTLSRDAFTVYLIIIHLASNP